MGDPDTDDETAAALARIGCSVRDARLRLGLTQEQLAGATGIDYKRIQRIERGAVNITVRTLVRLATVLERSLHDFFVQ